MRRFHVLLSAAMVFGIVSLATAQSVDNSHSAAVDALDARQQVIADAQEALKAAPANQQRAEALNRAIRETFDFERLARESIGDNWNIMTEAQQTEYMRLFIELVESSTVSKLKNYRAADTEYVEVIDDGSEAIITTVVTSTEGDEVAIQYKLHKHDGRWWVWDTTVGLDTEITEYDISTAQNYRSAFNRIIGNDGAEELLSRLRTKAAD